MFVNWKAEEVPGMKRLLDEFSGGAEHLQNVDKDLSPSNLAILCLPLIMSIPPISLLGSVSTTATLWYAFATDFLAAMPLLIKGVELIIAYKKATAGMASTISMMGEKHGIFEAWNVECRTPTVRVGWVGAVLVIVSSWFIAASNYVEFLFWRAVQYKRGQLKEILAGRYKSSVEETPDRRTEIVDGIETPPRHRCRFHRRRIIIIGLIVVAAAVILAPIETSEVREVREVGYVASNAVFSILVVLIRLLVLHRLFQFAQWRFIFGIIFGLTFGPLYLFLHAFKSVRNSEKWGEISEGAHIGFASFAMISKFLIDLIVIPYERH